MKYNKFTSPLQLSHICAKFFIDLYLSVYIFLTLYTIFSSDPF